jgi:YaaC-like Protein
MPAPPDILLGPVKRYEADGTFSSALDPLVDLTLHLNFLNARDYVVALLRTAHNVSAKDAAARASSIRSHAQLAAQYAHQIRVSTPDVAFVPCYYAILNLVKVYILFSPQHAQLAANRHHGATYRSGVNRFRNLPTDAIKLEKRGTIPLFYEVITGTPFQAQYIRMAEVYPFIQDVGAEWQLAVRSDRRVFLGHEVAEHSSGLLAAKFTVVEPTIRKAIPVAHLPALRDFSLEKGSKTAYVSTVPLPRSSTVHDVIVSGLDRRYLYYPTAGYTVTTRMSTSMRMPEELPLVLAFFHMSSIARYHPERLEKLRASKFWPVVVALQSHGMHKFLMLFWSYLRQANVGVVR